MEAVAIVGLASLFSTCIDCFKVIESCKSYSQDYWVLIVQLDVEKASLLQWSEGVGLFSSDPRTQQSELREERTQEAIWKILVCMQQLLTNTEQLRSKYGFVESDGNEDGMSSAVTTIVSSPRLRTFNEACARIHLRRSRQQQATSFFAKMKWAIRDHDAFVSWVNQIHGFVKDLWRLVPVPSQFERLMVKEDIDTLPNDLFTLRLVDGACSGRADHWSEAASMRLESSQSATQDKRDMIQWIQDVASTGIRETSDSFSQGLAPSLRSEDLNSWFEVNDRVGFRANLKMCELRKCDNKYEQSTIFHRNYLQGYHVPNNSTIIKPNNIAEIVHAMENEPSPLLVSWLSTQSFQRFKELNATSPNIAAQEMIIPLLTGHYNQICCDRPAQHCILRPALDGHVYIPSLDLVDSSAPRSVNEDILEGVRPLLHPGKMQHFVMAPNFILEVASPRESMRSLMMGVRQNSSVAAEFIHRLRILGTSDGSCDGNAYSFTSTFHNGTLKIFTTCVVRSDNISFHSTLLGTWTMTASVEIYQEGLTSLRNISAFANAKRSQFIEMATKTQTYK